MLNSKTFLSISTAAAIVVAPMLAFGQTAAVPNDARGGMTAQAPATGSTAPGNTGTSTRGTTTPGTTTMSPPATGTTGTTATGTTATGTTATGTTTPTLSVDSMSLRESRRASEIIGSNIYNDENNSIGEVDDLIVPQGGTAPVAVISVGGFLGIGAKLVAIPYDRLTHDTERNRWVLRGATKESLESLPTFSYDNTARRG